MLLYSNLAGHVINDGLAFIFQNTKFEKCVLIEGVGNGIGFIMTSLISPTWYHLITMGLLIGKGTCLASSTPGVASFL